MKTDNITDSDKWVVGLAGVKLLTSRLWNWKLVSDFHHVPALAALPSWTG